MFDDSDNGPRHGLTARGLSFRNPRNLIIIVSIAFFAFFIVARTGLLATLMGDSVPRYLVSEPAVSVHNGAVEMTYWVHVPRGTEPETVRETIQRGTLREVRGHTVEIDGDYKAASIIRFHVYNTTKPGEDTLKEAGVDEPDLSYTWTQMLGLKEMEPEADSSG